MEQTFSTSSSSSNNNNAQGGGTGVPRVQGFIFTEGEAIPNLNFFDPNNRPNARTWNAMLAQLRAAGAATADTTPQGKNHPCQTEDLRCDHQGMTSSKPQLVNTQVQVGGLTYYKREKYKGQQESTTVSVVHVHPDCYNSPLIEEALAQAHDYSFRTNKVVILTPAGVAAIAIPTTAARTRPYTFICGRCGNQYVEQDAVTLGVKLGSYPPSCGKTGCSIVRTG